MGSNITVKPPENKIGSLQFGNPNEPITDPEILAYRAVLKATSDLWNLHQALERLNSGYQDRAIEMLVGA